MASREMPTSLVTREGSLCQTCSNLGFQPFFNSVPSSEVRLCKEFDFVINVTASSFTCPLCSLTRRLWVSMPDIFQLFRGDTPSTHDVIMTLKKSRSGQAKLLCDLRRSCLPSPCNWPKDLEQVDLGPLKQAFAQCKTEHGPTCGVRSRIPVEGLRVYNCLTNKLEEGSTDTKYVALSYVWGSDPECSFQKPPEQRRTIRDGIHVALLLGYKYIWVDQLCINQGGPHKQQQIQQMNRIYQNADLTIVAAAGDNSDFGIPGVQGRSRIPQTCFKIGDIQLVEWPRHPRMLLSWTTWGSRAWTFQEEKLSHRLLVFTDRAAWFSCYLTPAEEGFETKAREKYGTPSRNIELALARKTPRPTCGLEKPLHINDLLLDYSQRFLTYPSDAVNAFSGILAELKESRLIISHVWGTPIMPPIALLNTADVFDPGPGVVHLERGTVDGFIVSLMWVTYIPEEFEPKHGIPSWSWAGWRGCIYLGALYDEENVNLGIEVFIERTDGQVLTWSEFEDLSYLENQSHLISRFIRLRAWTIDVRLEYQRLPKGGRSRECSRWAAVIQMLNGDELRFGVVILGEPLKASSTEQLDEFNCRVCTGVCLFPINNTSKATRYVMLLDKVNGNFQRIGSFDLCQMGHLRQTGPSGKVTYCDWDCKGQMPGLKTRMEEIRIG